MAAGALGSKPDVARAASARLRRHGRVVQRPEIFRSVGHCQQSVSRQLWGIHMVGAVPAFRAPSGNRSLGPEFIQLVRRQKEITDGAA